jgi:hypothetical protein
MAATNPPRTTGVWGAFARLSTSVKTILAGILLLVGAFPLIAWVETRAVDAARFIEDRNSLATSAAPDAIDPANEGRLVHVVGELTTGETLSDPLLGVSLTALKMERQVEMFQWIEHLHDEQRPTATGGTESRKVATYSREWSAAAVDSSKFVERGYVNPTQRAVADWRDTVSTAKLGVFTVPDFLIEQYQALTPVELTDADLARLDSNIKSTFRLHRGQLVNSADSSSPQVGDLRIRVVAARPGVVTVLAMQSGQEFARYLPNTAGLTPVGVLRNGTVEAADLLSRLSPDSHNWTWWLRGLGALLVWLGVLCVGGPLTRACSLAPFASDVVKACGRFFPTVVALFVWACTLSSHWFGLRPMFVILWYIVMIFVLFQLWQMGRRTATRRTGSA